MLFFKPGWLNKDPYKAIRAITKVNKQSELEAAVKEALHDTVRLHAAERLENKELAQAVLKELAFKSRYDSKAGKNIWDNSYVGLQAAKLLKDQKKILEASELIYPPKEKEYSALYSKIDDKDILIEIALQKPYGYLVVKKIAGEYDLIRIASVSSFEKTRAMAIERIESDEGLKKAAMASLNLKIALNTANKIKDQTIAEDTYKYIANNTSINIKDRAEAAKKLNEKGLFEKLSAEYTKVNENRLLQEALSNPEVALKVIPDINNENILAEIAVAEWEKWHSSEKHHPTRKAWIAAIEKITNQELLYKIAMSNVGGFRADAEEAALKKINKLELLEKYAMNVSPIAFKPSVISQINDHNSLKRIAEQTLTEMAYEAAKKIKNQRLMWKNIGDSGYDTSKIHEFIKAEIDDQDLLAEILKESSCQYYKWVHSGPSADKAKTWYNYNLSDEGIKAALEKLTDRQLIIDVAKNAKMDKVREAAEKKLIHLKIK